MDLFEEDLPIIFEKGKAEIFYYSNFFSKKEALELFQEINTQVDWEIERDQMNSAPDPLWSEDESASETWRRGRDPANESYWDDED